MKFPFLPHIIPNTPLKQLEQKTKKSTEQDRTGLFFTGLFESSLVVGDSPVMSGVYIFLINTAPPSLFLTDNFRLKYYIYIYIYIYRGSINVFPQGRPPPPEFKGSIVIPCHYSVLLTVVLFIVLYYTVQRITVGNYETDCSTCCLYTSAYRRSN